ncbi:hypothetical protein ACR03S_10310 [Limimaricola variabilis]
MSGARDAVVMALRDFANEIEKRRRNAATGELYDPPIFEESDDEVIED